LDFIEALQKEGENIQVAADAAQVEGWLHSGNYALNYAISGRFNRGYPYGHMIEVYGAEATGKSFLTARAVSEMQQAGGYGLYDDTEGALSENWIRTQLGVDTTKLIYKRSHTVEEHFDHIKTVLNVFDEQDAPKPLFIGLDSASLLTTEHELKVGLDKPSMERAKKLHAFCRILAKELHARPIVYLATNHVYDNIGAKPWESNTKSSGGSAFKYESSIRISMRTPKKIKKNREVVGVVVRAVVEKSRFTPPYKEAEIAIPYKNSISETSGLIPILLDLEVLTIDGHTLKYEGKDTKIKVHKTSKLKQDNSGKKLLKNYPDILDKTDEMLDRQEAEIFGEDFEDAEVEEA